MKKKIIIVVALVVVLALGGTLVLAAVDEDGNWVNPFTNILSDKVVEGTITQADMDTFNKVWEEIKGDMERPDGKMRGKEHLDIDAEFMSEIKEVMSQKTTEALDKLVADGILTSEEVEALSEKGNNFALIMKDADEETISTLKEAMAAVKDEITAYLEEKVADGTISQEQADMFSRTGSNRGNIADRVKKGGEFNKRNQSGKRESEKSDSTP